MNNLPAQRTWVLTDVGAVEWFAMQQRIVNLETAVRYLAQQLQQQQQSSIYNAYTRYNAKTSV